MKTISGIFRTFALFLVAMLGISASAQTTATATATLFDGFVVEITVANGGSGYGWSPLVAIVGGGGSGAGAYATVSGGAVTSITVTNAGFGYTNTPQVIVDPPSTTPFSSSLVLDLPLDGNIEDAGPYHLTVMTNGGGTFVLNRNLQARSALALDGASQYISILNDSRLYPDEMTLSAWVNFQQLSGEVWRAGDAESDVWRGFGLGFDGQTLLYSDWNGNGGNNAIVSLPSTNFVVGTWYQIVITRASNSCSLFLNGVKVGSQSGLSPYAKPQTVNMLLGANYNFDESIFAFCPVIFDNVHIYNRALTDNEVQTLYMDEAPQGIPILGISTAIRINMQVIPGKTYQLQSSTDLNSWTPEGSPFTATNSTAFQYFDAGESHQFFRLVEGQ